MEFIDCIKVSQVDRVIMHSEPFKPPLDGTLCITGHHLILSARQEGAGEMFQLLHQCIDTIEKRPSNIAGGSLTLKCKDFRVFKLDIASTEDLMKVATTIESILDVGENNVLWMYPFFFLPLNHVVEDGWTAYRPESTFNKLTLCNEWRLTYVNKNFDVCPTYPKVLVVPKLVDDDTVIASAKFRSGGRFPVLSYRHSVGSVLMRSSQPLVGPSSKRCKEDERLLNAVLSIGKRGFIIDTRSQIPKKNNSGCEPQAHYPQWRRSQKPIERPHILLESLSKLIEACHDKGCSMDKWSSKLESSNWLTHVRDALNCACLTAQCLDQDASPVLVHGSEGTDCTLLVTSLVQIILNPESRTIRGLQALIEREWLQAGHPFMLRHARGCFSSSNSGRTKSHGATFLLFLDCVWQIQNQFICSFEFSPSFLILLYEHSCSSVYGTFLGNCEADRDMFELPQKTLSLWTHINQINVIEKLLNPLYAPHNKIIWPSVAAVSLTLWRDLYLRWTIDLSRDKKVWDGIERLLKQNRNLVSKTTLLRQTLGDLERQAAEMRVKRYDTIDSDSDSPFS